MQSGILLVDKPRDKTSFYLVNVLRRITKIKKIGHAGTLDPFATGVMVMLIGREYTQKSDSFLNHDKEYIAEIKLGESTDTYDCDGKIVQTSSHVPSDDEIADVLAQLEGNYEQTPPMYSAKKVNGKKLYELARKGIEIERKTSIVQVHIECLEYKYPLLKVKIACSKGTYIRSIAHDLGTRLGSFAHVKELVRSKSGPFSLNECTTITDLESESFDLSKALIRTQ